MCVLINSSVRGYVTRANKTKTDRMGGGGGGAGVSIRSRFIYRLLHVNAEEKSRFHQKTPSSCHSDNYPNVTGIDVGIIGNSSVRCILDV